MPSRARDWFNQAERDLEQAKDSQEAGRHEWACFAAQQAAAKSAKALQLHLGYRNRTHSISGIFNKLQEVIKIPATIWGNGSMLDKLYFLARYPNSHRQGAPFEHFGSLQSDAAISFALEIMDFAGAQMV